MWESETQNTDESSVCDVTSRKTVRKMAANPDLELSPFDSDDEEYKNPAKKTKLDMSSSAVQENGQSNTNDALPAAGSEEVSVNHVSHHSAPPGPPPGPPPFTPPGARTPPPPGEEDVVVLPQANSTPAAAHDTSAAYTDSAQTPASNGSDYMYPSNPWAEYYSMLESSGYWPQSTDSSINVPAGGCSFCMLEDHDSESCPNISAEPTPHCDRCGQDGHATRDCQQRRTLLGRLGDTPGGGGLTSSGGGLTSSPADGGWRFGSTPRGSRTEPFCARCMQQGHETLSCGQARESPAERPRRDDREARPERERRPERPHTDSEEYGKNSYNRNGSCRYCRSFEHEPFECDEMGDYLCLKCSRTGHGYWECRHRPCCSFCSGEHERRHCDQYPHYVEESHKPIPKFSPQVPKEWRKKKITPSDIAPFRATYAEWGIFSNFYPHKAFTFWGKQYETVEHAYQAYKAEFYKDKALAEQVRRVPKDEPMKTKELVKHLKENKHWVLERAILMYDLVWLKVMYCDKFKSELVKSGDKILAEATSNMYWATGLNVEGTLRTPPAEWPGQNVLGRIQMTIRSELQKGKRNHFKFLTSPMDDKSDSDLDSDDTDDEAGKRGHKSR